MAPASRRKKITDALITAALAAAAGALCAYPAESVDAARGGLALCANVIVPSLFPFFVLSSLVVETGVTRFLSRAAERVMRPLFGVGGGCAAAFALGFVGGYPVGAKTVISLYEGGECTKTEAERLLSFCSNSGPAFIFGVVGAGVFASGRIGLLLYLAHTAASVLVGIIFRGWGGKSGLGAARPAPPRKKKTFSAAFAEAVRSSFLSTLNICGFVIFFTVFIRLLFLSGALPAISGLIGRLFAPLGLGAGPAESLLTGVIEISSGVWTLKGAAGHLTGSVAMAAFMLGWAGLSVHSQVLSFIGESGLSAGTYILGKLLQGVISAALIFVTARFINLSVPAAVVLAGQVDVYSGITFGRALAASSIGAAVTLGLFALLAWWVDRRW
ncbi:MAG: sporulation protein [Oscillospiraceae bacterium]|jgi:sporulation integral membrane protein YlbJ|nr:sporulation protein [Oscillospiraceae bacterium]